MRTAVRPGQVGGLRGASGIAGLLVLLATIGAGVAAPANAAVAAVTAFPQSLPEASTPTLMRVGSFLGTHGLPAYEVTVNWGDGTRTENAEVLYSPDATHFEVFAGHAYVDEGEFPLSFEVVDAADQNNISTTSTIATSSVADADNLVFTGGSLAPTAGVPFNATLGTFTDTYAGNTASDLTASVDWASGMGIEQSPGVVSGSAGRFAVAGSHTYPAAGRFEIFWLVHDDYPGNGSSSGTFTRAGVLASNVLSVSLTGAGKGSVSGPGIGCPSVCSAIYATGTLVTLTAVSTTGSTFTGWGGACAGSGTCSVALSSDRSVIANFTEDPPGRHGLTVLRSGTGSGTVTSSDGQINCGMSCTHIYADGAKVALTALAAPGSTFTGWGGACGGVKDCTVTIAGDRLLSATFSSTRAGPAPEDSALSISPARFAAADTGPAIAASAPRSGATISYRDSENATTRFTIERPASGIRRKARCTAPPRHLAKGAHPRACTRYLPLGSFSHTDAAGANHFHFSGRLGTGKLAPGPYSMTVVPRNRAGRSGATLRRTFRIAR